MIRWDQLVFESRRIFCLLDFRIYCPVSFLCWIWTSRFSSLHIFFIFRARLFGNCVYVLIQRGMLLIWLSPQIDIQRSRRIRWQGSLAPIHIDCTAIMCSRPFLYLFNLEIESLFSWNYSFPSIASRGFSNTSVVFLVTLSRAQVFNCY